MPRCGRCWRLPLVWQPVSQGEAGRADADAGLRQLRRRDSYLILEREREVHVLLVQWIG